MSRHRWWGVLPWILLLVLPGLEAGARERPGRDVRQRGDVRRQVAASPVVDPEPGSRAGGSGDLQIVVLQENAMMEWPALLIENRNDDDDDGVPDYADGDVVFERNVRVLKVIFLDQPTPPGGTIEFHYHGAPTPPSYVGRDIERDFKVYWDDRVGRLRLWNTTRADLLPASAYLAPNASYPLSDFTFEDSTDFPGSVELSVRVEAVNATVDGVQVLDDQAVVTATVFSGGEASRSSLTYTLVQGNLAVNNSNPRHAADTSVIGELPELPELPDDEDPETDPCDTAPNPACCRAARDWDGSCPVPAPCVTDPDLGCLCCFECCFTGDGCEQACIDQGCCPQFAPSSALGDGPPVTLRPGVSDVEWLLDVDPMTGVLNNHDEALEDQNGGLRFWATESELADLEDPTFDTHDLEDLAPLLIELPQRLLDMDYTFHLESDGNSSVARLHLYTVPPEFADAYLDDPRLHVKKVRAGLLQRILEPDDAGEEEDEDDEERLVGVKTVMVRPGALPVELPVMGELRQRQMYMLRVRQQADYPGQSFRVSLIARSPHGEPDQTIDSIKLNASKVRRQYWFGSCRLEPRGENTATRDYVLYGPALGGETNCYPLDGYDRSDVYAEESRYCQGGRIFFPPMEKVSGSRDPDKTKHLVYLHGFNMTPEAVEAANDIYFKRFHWLGFRGNYVALNWFGDPSFARTNEPRGSGLPQFYDGATRNAFRTSPSYRHFLKDVVQGQWGVAPEDVDIVAHSLGNLVVMDALRVHVAEGSGAAHPGGPSKLARHFYSLDAAVWEDVFLPQEEISYPAVDDYIDEFGMEQIERQEPIDYPVDALVRHSWAFWCRQDGRSIKQALDGGLIHGYNPRDYALALVMRFNDWRRHNPLPGTQRLREALLLNVLTELAIGRDIIGDGLFDFLLEASSQLEEDAHFYRERLIPLDGRGSAPDDRLRQRNLNNRGLDITPTLLISGLRVPEYQAWFTNSPIGRLENEHADVQVNGGLRGWNEFAHSDHRDVEMFRVFEWYEAYFGEHPRSGLPDLSPLPLGKE
ncbi:MAG: hypothetical protein AAF533_04040 [Acidobacteriota bacterium]